MTDIDQYLTEREAQLRAIDWHDVPRGYYAVPIDEPDEPFRTLGYKLFERKIPRTYKNGHTVGRDQWRRSYVLSDGVTWDELHTYLEDYDCGDYTRQADVEFVLDYLDECRAEFGRLTGRCGFCGKPLTDPDSKMRGIGPDCAGLR